MLALGPNFSCRGDLKRPYRNGGAPEKTHVQAASRRRWRWSCCGLEQRAKGRRGELDSLAHGQDHQFEAMFKLVSEGAGRPGEEVDRRATNLGGLAPCGETGRHRDDCIARVPVDLQPSDFDADGLGGLRVGRRHRDVAPEHRRDPERVERTIGLDCGPSCDLGLVAGRMARNGVRAVDEAPGRRRTR